MNATDAILMALKSTEELTTTYLADLSDADLLARPVPGANHIAWQLGHVLIAERFMLAENLPGVTFPAFPAGFVEAHTPERAGKDDGFFPKSVYLEQLAAVRGATVAGLNQLSAADLDRATVGSIARFAPTLGALLILVANHTMMHSGQFTVVRRKLGKPILF
jgi:hypothetical protein